MLADEADGVEGWGEWANFILAFHCDSDRFKAGPIIHSDADPDPTIYSLCTFTLHADSDPASQNDVALCESGSTALLFK